MLKICIHISVSLKRREITILELEDMFESTLVQETYFKEKDVQK